MLPSIRISGSICISCEHHLHASKASTLLVFFSLSRFPPSFIRSFLFLLKNRVILTNVNPMKPVTTALSEKADSSFTGSLSKRGSLDVHFCRRSVSRKPCCYLDDASTKRNEGNTYSRAWKSCLLGETEKWKRKISYSNKPWAINLTSITSN